MKTKNETIDAIMTTVYDSSKKLVVSSDDIKAIESAYKAHEKDPAVRSVQDLVNAEPDIKDSVNKMKSGKEEIQHQLDENKGLQSAILAECVYTQTLAETLGLNRCVDLEKTPMEKIPVEYRSAESKIQAKAHAAYAARYFYYKPGVTNKFLVQYGNPVADGDASIILYDNTIIVEIKEMPARANEVDLVFDDNGTLIIPEETKVNRPELIPMVDKFNSETNEIECLGHNYSNFTRDEALGIIDAYFRRGKVDLLLTADKNDEIVVLRPEQLQMSIRDGDGFKPIIVTNGSEIRSTGKNRVVVFTPNYLQQVLAQNNAVNMHDDVYTIENQMTKEVGPVAARGKTNVCHWFKISQLFEVNVNKIISGDIYTKGSQIEFRLSDVRERKPTICAHLDLNCTKRELSKWLRENKMSQAS